MSYPGIALKNKLPTKRAFPLVEKWFLRHIFNAIGLAPVGLQFRSGKEISVPGISALPTVTIRDYRTLVQLMVDPEVAFGEAYSAGRIQVEGDLVRLLEVVYRSMASACASNNWYQRWTDPYRIHLAAKRKSWIAKIGGFLPEQWIRSVARQLLRRQWFVRSVVLNHWFLPVE